MLHFSYEETPLPIGSKLITGNHELIESNMSMRQGSGISVSSGQPPLAEVQAKHLFVAYASNNKHSSCAVQSDLNC